MHTNNKIATNRTTQMIANRKQQLRKRFRPFTGVAHRLEQIRIKNGVVFINDSKAENVNATYFALQSIQKPIVWIAGGNDALTDYWELMSLVRQKVKAIVMIGQNNERLLHFFAPVMSQMYEVNDMIEAVQLAYRLSEPGTSVLLSPACKPDWRYPDYQSRGEAFVKAVNHKL